MRITIRYKLDRGSGGAKQPATYTLMAESSHAWVQRKVTLPAADRYDADGQLMPSWENPRLWGAMLGALAELATKPEPTVRRPVTELPRPLTGIPDQLRRDNERLGEVLRRFIVSGAYSYAGRWREAFKVTLDGELADLNEAEYVLLHQLIFDEPPDDV